MKKTLMIKMCSLMFVVPALSFAQEMKEQDPDALAYLYVNESAELKQDQDLLDDELNKENWNERQIEKEPVEEKKWNDQEAKDEDEGQIKVEF